MRCRKYSNVSTTPWEVVWHAVLHSGYCECHIFISSYDILWFDETFSRSMIIRLFFQTVCDIYACDGAQFDFYLPCHLCILHFWGFYATWIIITGNFLVPILCRLCRLDDFQRQSTFLQGTHPRVNFEKKTTKKQKLMTNSFLLYFDRVQKWQWKFII